MSYGGAGAHVICYKCQQPGHFASTCPNRDAGRGGGGGGGGHGGGQHVQQQRGSGGGFAGAGPGAGSPASYAYRGSFPPLSELERETALDFFLRVRSGASGGGGAGWMRTGLDVLDELDSSGESGRAVRGLAPGNVIEVYGESGSGKSELLLHVLVRTILPQAAGGQESGVVIFDNDMSLDILKLARRLGAALQAAATTAAAAAAADGTGVAGGTAGAAAGVAAAVGAGGGAAGAGSGQQPHPPHPPHVVPAPLDDDALEAAVVECLRRVHVYRCRSSLECLVTLHAVREVLVHDPVPVRALLFDSLAAFHFQDKAIEDQGGRMMRMHLARTVSSLVADHRLLVLGAKPAL